MNDFINNNPVTMCCKYQKELDKNILKQADKEKYYKHHQAQTMKNNGNNNHNGDQKSLFYLELFHFQEQNLRIYFDYLRKNE